MYMVCIIGFCAIEPVEVNNAIATDIIFLKFILLVFQDKLLVHLCTIEVDVLSDFWPENYNQEWLLVRSFS